MNNSDTSLLSKGKITQVSLNTKIDNESIDNYLLSNIKNIKLLIDKKKDKYANKLFEYLKEKKKLIFKINKHEEILIKKYQNDLEKTLGYILFRYKFHLCGKEKINLGYPPYLLIEPVSACNLRCPFCFQTDKSFSKKPFMGVMNYELFKKIVDEADKLEIGAITLASRGEPTMHKKLGSMIDYIVTKKNFYEIKINSNGTFLNEDICHKIFKNNVTQIVISSDHYIKEDYERLRLGSNFEDVVTKVDMLFNIRKKFYPNSITEIRISGVDNEKNLDRQKFNDFWIKRSDHVTAGFPLERWNTYENKIENDNLQPCELLWDRMYIWFDGKVNPCDADYKSILSYGNFNENSISEIWNSKKINETRQKHLSSMRNKLMPCDRCGIKFQ